ncbi:MAG: hypothetical protein ACKVQB_08785 [Bacteroidia bacterium]
MKIFFSLLIVFFTTALFAQREHHADLTYSYGKYSNTVSGNVVKNFKLLKSEKLHLGVGARAGYVQGFIGNTFLTAPAKHKKSGDGIDTIFVLNPMFLSINLTLNASYHFTPEWSVGANIDAIGFTFGKKRNSDYFPSFASQNEETPRTKLINEQVKPTQNNFLLIGNNNKGTIYSEVFARYRYKERYSLKVGYSFITTEYATKNRVGHNNNYRFRNTSGQILIGFGYSFI